MAGLLDNLVKGLSTLAPQDDPGVKLFSAQSELKSIEEKEKELYAALGRKVYAENGAAAYGETAVQLEALELERKAVEQRLGAAQAEKAAKERSAAEAEASLTCPACGAVNPEGTKFCQECGAKLGIAHCTACGAALKPGMRFCGECGAKQEG